MEETSLLKDIGVCKEKLSFSFLDSPEICEIMIGKKNYSEEEVQNLIYKQIFPYLYIDETQTKVLSYICLEIDIPKAPTSTVKNLKLIVWIYSHKEGMKYYKKGYSGTKVDILTDMVERQLRNSYKFGIGKLELMSCQYFFPNNKYYGKQLIYNVPDFKLKDK